MTEPTSSYEGRLIARPDDRVSLSQALLLGLQHVMARALKREGAT